MICPHLLVIKWIFYIYSQHISTQLEQCGMAVNTRADIWLIKMLCDVMMDCFTTHGGGTDGTYLLHLHKCTGCFWYYGHISSWKYIILMCFIQKYLHTKVIECAGLDARILPTPSNVYSNPQGGRVISVLIHQDAILGHVFINKVCTA